MSPATRPSTTAAKLRATPPSTYNQDCWSPEETDALIDAWGSIHLSLNRGSLRHHQWSDVSSAVNSTVNRHRTDSQCKNRVDTLKKKYKIEKAKVAVDSDYVSPWPFFRRLDFLISGEDDDDKDDVTAVRTPLITSFPVKRRSAIPKRPARWLTENDDSSSEDKEVIGGCVGDGGGGGGGSREVKDEDVTSIGNSGQKSEMKTKEKEKDGCGTLAEAIRRFGEVYERVELVKHEKLIELEKLRMEFAKDLELQRIKLLMDSQRHLFSRIKRSKHHHHPPPHPHLDSYS